MPTKLKQRFEEPNHARFLTFGCYRRKMLFSNPEMAFYFVHLLARLRDEGRFFIWAYVVMPNHVHLMLKPANSFVIGKEIANVKRTFALWAAKKLRTEKILLAKQLEVNDHGKRIIRFWQAGGGYDRNIWSDEELIEKVQYIHNNPVRAGLVQYPEDYIWSSARFWNTGKDYDIELDKPEWW